MMDAMTTGHPESTTDAREAIAELYRVQYRDLVRLAALLLDERGASEEVVQDAFVKLQLGWDRLRDHDRADAWLRSAVLNGARSRMRRRLTVARHPEPPPGDAASAESGALASDAHERMIAALRRLPGRQREALVLRYYLDLSEAEMSDAMGIAAGSVKTHLHRGIDSLKQHLEELR